MNFSHLWLWQNMHKRIPILTKLLYIIKPPHHQQQRIHSLPVNAGELIFHHIFVVRSFESTSCNPHKALPAYQRRRPRQCRRQSIHFRAGYCTRMTETLGWATRSKLQPCGWWCPAICDKGSIGLQWHGWARMGVGLRTTMKSCLYTYHPQVHAFNRREFPKLIWSLSACNCHQEMPEGLFSDIFIRQVVSH